VSDSRSLARRTATAGQPRSRRIRRATGLLTPLRAGAALVLLLAALGVYGVGASPAFSFQTLVVHAADKGLVDERVVAAQLALDTSKPNLFLLDTRALERTLEALAPVTGARVTVELPDTVRVVIEEREPILVWAVGAKRLLVDRAGGIFSNTAGADFANLPMIIDQRAGSAALDTGSTVPAVDLDAATRLASLTPGDIGSRATGLSIVITDDTGYELRPEGVAWVAQLGFFTPTLRSPELIPGQVRLLRSLLAGREESIARVTLVDDRNGTYTTR
jgi:cell division septal protein FtsQ